MRSTFKIGDTVEVIKGKNKGKIFKIDSITIFKEGIAVYEKKSDEGCWDDEVVKIEESRQPIPPNNPDPIMKGI